MTSYINPSKHAPQTRQTPSERSEMLPPNMHRGFNTGTGSRTQHNPRLRREPQATLGLVVLKMDQALRLLRA